MIHENEDKCEKKNRIPTTLIELQGLARRSGYTQVQYS